MALHLKVKIGKKITNYRHRASNSIQFPCTNQAPPSASSYVPMSNKNIGHELDVQPNKQRILFEHLA